MPLNIPGMFEEIAVGVATGSIVGLVPFLVGLFRERKAARRAALVDLLSLLSEEISRGEMGHRIGMDYQARMRDIRSATLRAIPALPGIQALRLKNLLEDYQRCDPNEDCRRQLELARAIDRYCRSL